MQIEFDPAKNAANIKSRGLSFESAGEFDFGTANIEGISKNSEFAQMQGVEKMSPRCICVICKQEIFSATRQLGYNEVAVQANL